MQDAKKREGAPAPFRFLTEREVAALAPQQKLDYFRAAIDEIGKLKEAAGRTRGKDEEA